MPGPAPSDSRTAAGRTWLAGLLLVIAALGAQLPALHGGWLWDDDALVLNRFVRSPAGLADIWAGRSPQEYLPIATSLYWLEFRLWGDDAGGFHAVELLLHAAAVLACWRMLVAWSRLGAARSLGGDPRVDGMWRTEPAATGTPPSSRTAAFSAAWWGALLFAVHPLTVASVAWVAETKNLLALLFAALATRAWIAWLDRGSRRVLVLGVIAFTATLLSKSSFVMLPAVLLVLAWWHARGLRRRDLFASAPFFAVSLVLGLVTVHVQHSQTLGAGLAGSESLLLRLAAAGRSVWWYIGKSLAPLDLTVIYPRWAVDPGNVVAWLPLAALLLALGLLLRARQPMLRAAGAGLLAFALMLLPALGLIEMSYMAIARVGDHYAYPALLVPCALLAFAGTAVAEQARRRGDPGLLRSLAVAGVLAVLALAAASHQRAGLYASQVTLFGDNVARVPEAWLAQNNLGGALLAAGDAAGAESHLRAAIALHPGYGEPRDNLGKLLLDAGRLEEARVELQQALLIAPELPGVHADLGRLELAEGHVDAAIEALQRALQLDAGQSATHNVLGVAMASRGAAGDVEAAERSFRRALELRANYPEALNNLGRLLMLRAGAVGPAEGGVRAPPDPAAEAWLAEAERSLRRALELSPGYAAARENVEALMKARR